MITKYGRHLVIATFLAFGRKLKLLKFSFLASLAFSHQPWQSSSQSDEVCYVNHIWGLDYSRKISNRGGGGVGGGLLFSTCLLKFINLCPPAPTLKYLDLSLNSSENKLYFTRGNPAKLCDTCTSWKFQVKNQDQRKFHLLFLHLTHYRMFTNLVYRYADFAQT